MEQFYYVGFTILGVFIGYILSRRQQDKPIVDIRRDQGPVNEDITEDPYFLATHTDEEIRALKSRVPTKEE